MPRKGLRIALTAGEPAGIGPDLVAHLAGEASAIERVLVGDAGLLAARAERLGLALHPYPLDPAAPPRSQAPGEIAVDAVPLAAPVEPGRLDPANARFVVATLARASDGCRDGRFDALVTAPVHKGVINDAGIAFTGHTEFLGERTGQDPVMLLAAGALRVALVTTHLPLRRVAEAVTGERVERAARIVDHDLRHRFAIERPRLSVLGLNPHAGEGGHLGTEERDAIAPALERLRGQGIDAVGPVPADTAFTPAALEHTDAVLAMYHDQGLPALKQAGFGEAVNVTLGLPLIRTSVDHGTALELAGTGRARADSLRAALACALELAGRN